MATQDGITIPIDFPTRDEPKTRAELVDQRTNEAKALAGLQVEKASIEGERRRVEADLGPVRYLATLLGAGDQDVLRYFILVVARRCCCWPRRRFDGNPIPALRWSLRTPA